MTASTTPFPEKPLSHEEVRTAYNMSASLPQKITEQFPSDSPPFHKIFYPFVAFRLPLPIAQKALQNFDLSADFGGCLHTHDEKELNIQVFVLEHKASATMLVQKIERLCPTAIPAIASPFKIVPSK